MNRVLAVDLGGTKTAMALVDREGGVTDRRKLAAERTAEAAAGSIAEEARRSGAGAVGIIVPGIYDHHTGMAWAPNLWGWDEVPLRDLLAARLTKPFVIDSDRAGYVLGEQWLGAAQGLEDVAFVAVGTGIGIGILAGGQVISGAHGIAGAAGWFALDPRWREEYARCGCWESEAAGPAVARLAGAANAEEAAQRARNGDEKARAAFDHAADYLAMGIANLISLLNPQMIVLGGGLMQASDLLLEGIRAGVTRWAQPVAVKKAAIELTALGEDAGLLGAARLILRDPK